MSNITESIAIDKKSYEHLMGLVNSLKIENQALKVRVGRRTDLWLQALVTIEQQSEIISKLSPKLECEKDDK